MPRTVRVINFGINNMIGIFGSIILGYGPWVSEVWCTFCVLWIGCDELRIDRGWVAPADYVKLLGLFNETIP